MIMIIILIGLAAILVMLGFTILKDMIKLLLIVAMILVIIAALLYFGYLDFLLPYIPNKWL